MRRKAKQKCSIAGCDKDSIPGLKRGRGKCQYHWNAGVWGKKWADECERRQLATQRFEGNCPELVQEAREAITEEV